MGHDTGFTHIVIAENGEAVIERNGYKVSSIVWEKEAEGGSIDRLLKHHTDLTESEILSALAYHAHSLAVGREVVIPGVQVNREELVLFDDDDFLKIFRIYEGAELYEVFNSGAEDGFSAAA